jgi:MFS family permease
MTATAAGPAPGVEVLTNQSTPRVPATLWRNHDFLKFWSGETLSLFGTQVTNLAVPLTAVLAFHASAQQVGLLRFLQLAPYLGLAMIFGVWADRMRRKRVMLVANTSRMLLIGLIPLLSITHHLNLTTLLTIACAIGIFSVLFDVSWMSFVPTLVKDPKNYLEANHKLGITSASSDIAGPGIAGALISALTAPVALIVDAFSYLVSIATLLWISTPEPASTPLTTRRHLGLELREGLRWVFGHRILRPLALVAPFCNFCMVSIWTMFLLYAIRDEGLSATEVGVVFAASSIGGLIGSTVSATVIKRFRLGRVYAVSMTAVFTGPLLIPLAAGPKPALIATFIASFFLSYLGLGIANVTVISLRQTSTPPALMARMNAAFRTALFGGGALGGLAGGYIAGTVGLREGLSTVAVGSALMVIPLVLSPVSRLSELPTQTETLVG